MNNLANIFYRTLNYINVNIYNEINKAFLEPWFRVEYNLETFMPLQMEINICNQEKHGSVSLSYDNNRNKEK